MQKGIFLNGKPLNLEETIDIEIKMESFNLQYLYHPPAKVKSFGVRRNVKNSKVRHLTKDEYLKLTDINDAR